MNTLVRKLKTFILHFSRSPLATVTEAGRHLLSGGVSPQVSFIQEITEEKPLVLQVETTNVCNARCIFCAYPHMQRDKGVMDLGLFKKIVREYAAMGGGAVSLTPIQGEPLLDPHLMRRIRILDANPAINQVSLTTNAITLDRYSDEEVQYLLEALDFVQVSIGGLNEHNYRTLYGVDQFARVKRAMDRLLELNEAVANPTNLAFAFRTLDRKFERRFRRALDAYRRRGAMVSHICTYDNYGGLVDGDGSAGLSLTAESVEKTRPCALASMHMAVCWDGRITACGCADIEGRGLSLGRAERDSLADVWTDERRTGILNAFETGQLPEICRKCSAYQPNAVFASGAFRDVQPEEPLPVEFYHRFWGG